MNEHNGIYLTSKLCKTMDVSLGNSAFAGRLLEWVAESGSIFSMQQANTNLHMALYRIDNLRIIKPVKVGTLINFYAENVVIGNSSVSFKMVGYFSTGEEFMSLECTYVQLDENGKKKLIIK